MSGSLPYVFTIILNWNQAQLTLGCLKSLSKTMYSSNTVVVVDNGSTDGSLELIRSQYQDVVLLPQNENLGFCEGNNIGIRYALDQGADYVLLLNNDTEVSPDMIGKLVDACEANPIVGMAGPTMYYYDEPTKIASAGGRVDFDKGLYWQQQVGVQDVSLVDEHVQEVDYIVSCGVLVRRAAIEQIGLLDSRFFINGDDIDWGLRTIKAGFKVVYVPDAKMWHMISAAMGVASPAANYYITRNKFLIFGKHLRGVRRLKAQSLNFVRTLRTLLAWSLKPRYRYLKPHRDANLMALRDALIGRYGRMGHDVEAICIAKK